MLARPASEAIGDAHQRQLEYASILDRYDMVVRTLRGGRTPVQLASNLWVHPSASGSRGLFPVDAARLGQRIGRRVGSTLVSTEDPFLCGLAGYVVARRLGLPLSLQFAGDMIDNPFWLGERPLNRCLNPLGKWLIRRAQTLRVVSSSERDKLIRLGIAPDRVWDLGWITDFDRFQDADGAAIRQRWLDDRFDQLVVFVGRLVPQKDLFTLLSAAELVAADHPKSRFVVVGDGPLEGPLRAAITARNLDDSVLLAGPARYDDVPAVMAAADVVVLTSVYEGNARVLAEAAAAARPAVAADVSGSRDTVIDGETGFVVAVGDAAAFADRLDHLLDEPVIAQRMGQVARERILDLYSARRLLPRFREFWELTASMGPGQ